MKLAKHIDSNNTKVEVEMLTPKQLAKKEKDMQKIREQIAWEKALMGEILSATPAEQRSAELKKENEALKKENEELKEMMRIEREKELTKAHINAHFTWMKLGGVASGMTEPQPHHYHLP